MLISGVYVSNMGLKIYNLRQNSANNRCICCSCAISDVDIAQKTPDSANSSCRIRMLFGVGVLSSVSDVDSA